MKKRLSAQGLHVSRFAHHALTGLAISRTGTWPTEEGKKTWRNQADLFQYDGSVALMAFRVVIGRLER
jgi:hypothetical protein